MLVPVHTDRLRMRIWKRQRKQENFKWVVDPFLATSLTTLTANIKENFYFHFSQSLSVNGPLKLSALYTILITSSSVNVKIKHKGFKLNYVTV